MFLAYYVTIVFSTCNITPSFIFPRTFPSFTHSLTSPSSHLPGYCVPIPEHHLPSSCDYLFLTSVACFPNLIPFKCLLHLTSPSPHIYLLHPTPHLFGCPYLTSLVSLSLSYFPCLTFLIPHAVPRRNFVYSSLDFEKKPLDCFETHATLFWKADCIRALTVVR